MHDPTCKRNSTVDCRELTNPFRMSRGTHNEVIKVPCRTVLPQFPAGFVQGGFLYSVQWHRFRGGGGAGNALERHLSVRRECTETYAIVCGEDNTVPRCHRTNRSRIGSPKSADACGLKRTVDGVDRPRVRFLVVERAKAVLIPRRSALGCVEFSCMLMKTAGCGRTAVCICLGITPVRG